MDKLLFLAPDLDVAKAVVADLRADGFTEDDIGVLANEKTPMEDLSPADPEDQSDVLPAFGRGVVAGGATGLVAGLAALAFPPLGLVAGGAALVATTTLGGASFGAFASALLGTSVDNSQLREFEEELAKGSLLIIVDTEEERSSAVRDKLVAAHNTLVFAGEKGLPPAI